MLSSASEQQHLGEGERFRMRNREEGSRHAQTFSVASGAAVELQAWRAAAADDLDVLPQHAARLACPERLHRRLLRGEASGEVRNRIPPLCTIGNLAVREDAAQEPIAITLEDVRDAMEIRRIDADANDVHARASA